MSAFGVDGLIAFAVELLGCGVVLANIGRQRDRANTIGDSKNLIGRLLGGESDPGAAVGRLFTDCTNKLAGVGERKVKLGSSLFPNRSRNNLPPTVADGSSSRHFNSFSGKMLCGDVGGNYRSVFTGKDVAGAETLGTGRQRCDVIAGGVTRCTENRYESLR